MSHWAFDSIFYHIYPLGLCAAPTRNDFHSAPTPRLQRIHAWLDHIQQLGANALYLGPLFESTSHGYDTADYYHLDRRLGDDRTLAELSNDLHRRGIRLVLDGVFHHVGRDFWAFRDVRQNLRQSVYQGWFANLNFGQSSPYDDPFSYEGWSGHYDLVKLNLQNPEVRQHLFQAIAYWIEEFQIDGLRLDAADRLSQDFMGDLAAFCRGLRPDFWLMGEVVNGDYRQWAAPGLLDSVTNYEAYKGLYSSHADGNYFEIAYTLNRQFGPAGQYRRLPLYAFADNHDVSRVASSLKDPAQLYPLYCLLFTMPGVPSLYYGSEWGLAAKKSRGSDWGLRPALDLAAISAEAPQPDLPRAIAALAEIRGNVPALRYGDYAQLYVSHRQFSFCRTVEGQCAVVMVNSAPEAAGIEVDLPISAGRWVDLLNPGDEFRSLGRKLKVGAVSPCWGRILVNQT
ncbi:MAG TPA: alpha-amylase family glycosyl hydrolase [Anaerolineales bacterium]